MNARAAIDKLCQLVRWSTAVRFLFVYCSPAVWADLITTPDESERYMEGRSWPDAPPRTACRVLDGQTVAQLDQRIRNGFTVREGGAEGPFWVGVP